jgi:hypothetical protein
VATFSQQFVVAPIVVELLQVPEVLGVDPSKFVKQLGRLK